MRHSDDTRKDSPWQRGTVENTNGILRRDMPRKTDITDYTDRDIEMIQILPNSKPSVLTLKWRPQMRLVF